MQVMNGIVFQNIPELTNTTLMPLERRRLFGSGVRRYGYIDKVSDTATSYPQFWPNDIHGENGVVDIEVLKSKMREVEVLRNLVIFFRWLTRVCEDRFLVVSDEAFRFANAYYMSVRLAARRRSPGAEQVWQMLQSFHLRPRKSSGEPTQKQALKNYKLTQKGKRVGSVGAYNEGTTVKVGDKGFWDNTMPVNQQGVRMKETETLEASGMGGNNTPLDVEASTVKRGK
jgi:hypothetical protein